MQAIRNPIGKNITITTVGSNRGLKIAIHPNNQIFPHLYENAPFIVYGTIDQLKDFHVFYQGKYYDKFLDIKQAVSFEKATKVDSSKLVKKIALQFAYQGYARYLNDGNPNNLKAVKELLVPYRIPVAFK